MYFKNMIALAASALCAIAVAPSWAESENLLVHEDFSDGMARWWVEGGERTWVQDNLLHMRADPTARGDGQVATAWLRQDLPADVRVSFDAHVISSSREVNNINVFLHFSDPDDTPLYDSRRNRESGAYELYHELNGYIITFLADKREESLALPEGERPARIRIRRCPGFELLAETYAYNNVAGRTYHVEIEIQGGEIVFSVDGNELLRAQDSNPHQGGLLGLRTYRTHLTWSDIKATRLQTETK